MEESRNQFLAASRDTDYNDRGSVFYNLGLTQERLGELDDALASYRRAVELTRGDAESLLALSRVLTDTGNAAGANRYYSRLLAMIEKNPRMVHSAESLLTGIRIAREVGDENLAASLALQLRNNYPESVEYQRYKVLMSNEQCRESTAANRCARRPATSAGPGETGPDGGAGGQYPASPCGDYPGYRGRRLRSDRQ